MSTIDYAVHKVFNRSLTCFVRITPEKFIITYQGQHLPDDETTELCGSITRTRLIRKRFEDNCPVCQSRDGVTSTDGKSCEQCHEPDCRPGLRLQLISANRRCIIDLNVTSAQNLCAFDEQLQQEGKCLKDQPLRMRIKSHDYWAEVTFQAVDDQMSI